MSKITRVGAFGEMQLRFTPPEHLLLEQTRDLRIDYTGTGVNILANLSHFGLRTQMLTALPNNRIGDAASYALRGYGVDVDHVVRSHEYMGSYFAELGCGPRPTEVVYQNRRSSAFCAAGCEEYDFNAFLSDVDMVHICGIALCLTDQTAEAAIQLAKRAHGFGKCVCFDFNFRPTLNEHEGALELLRQRYADLLPCCDIVFGARSDLLRLEEEPRAEESDRRLIADFMKRFDVSWFVGTEKSSSQGSGGIERSMRGVVYERLKDTDDVLRHESTVRPVEVFDRIGAGDAFAAGIMYGYACGWEIERVLEFAAANAVLANATYGDVPLTTVDQVQRVISDPLNNLIR